MAKRNAKLLAQLKALETVPWICPVAAAEKIADLARGKAPVRTGFLRSSIKAQHLSRYSQVRVNAPYAGFVEYGTYKMAAQPFLRPAIDEHKNEILNTVAEALIGEISVALGASSSKKPAKKKRKK